MNRIETDPAELRNLRRYPEPSEQARYFSHYQTRHGMFDRRTEVRTLPGEYIPDARPELPEVFVVRSHTQRRSATNMWSNLIHVHDFTTARFTAILAHMKSGEWITALLADALKPGEHGRINLEDIQSQGREFQLPVGAIKLLLQDHISYFKIKVPSSNLSYNTTGPNSHPHFSGRPELTHVPYESPSGFNYHPQLQEYEGSMVLPTLSPSGPNFHPALQQNLSTVQTPHSESEFIPGR